MVYMKIKKKWLKMCTTSNIYAAGFRGVRRLEGGSRRWSFWRGMGYVEEEVESWRKVWTTGNELPGLVCTTGPDARHIWRGERWCAGLHCHSGDKRGQWTGLCWCNSHSGQCIALNGVEIVLFCRVWWRNFFTVYFCGDCQLNSVSIWVLDRFLDHHDVVFLLD